MRRGMCVNILAINLRSMGRESSGYASRRASSQQTPHPFICGIAVFRDVRGAENCIVPPERNSLMTFIKLNHSLGCKGNMVTRIR